MKLTASLFALVTTCVLPWAHARANDSAVSCRFIPEDPQQALVETCETASHYIYDFPARTDTFEIESYRQAIRTLVRAWQIDAGFSDKSIANTKIDTFLSVPDTDPNGAQLRVQGTSGEQKFVVYLDYAPNQWPTKAKRVGILHNANYPDTFGFEPGKVIVQLAEPYPDELLAAHLYGFDWTRVDANSIEVHCRPFAEQRTQAALLDRDKALHRFAHVSLNHWFEWIAYRGKTFTFSAVSR